MARISNRVGAIAESATMAITEKAHQLRASGLPVISFGAGEPDFPTPDHIVEAAVAAARDPRNHHYTPNAGLPELREAVAASTRSLSGVEVSPGQILITNGAKQAVYLGLAALLDPGDEVLVPAPYWVTYPQAAALSGGTPRFVPTTEAGGFKVTIADLERAATPRTKVLVFVSPSNPTGVVYDNEEVAAIGRWAGERGMWVLTDEIYQQLVYPSGPAPSIAGLPELDDRVVIVSGVAKSYAMTGWRVGWLIGPPDVFKAANNHQSHLSSNVNNIAQRAALAALSGPTDSITAMRSAFDRRRQKMVEMLTDMKGVSCLTPAGAFYTFPGVEDHLARFGDTLDFATYLLEAANVAVVPGEAFGASGHVRLSYALSDDDLVTGLTRMAEALEGL
ncbi:MAG TPA: pyridoxal phosphate-dependent aminotransferase [Acidimicrobiia bacterium]|nr:pyridoxal phosphate-dependent aminotransferase [Acidimicrobiia bacterium]